MLDLRSGWRHFYFISRGMFASTAAGRCAPVKPKTDARVVKILSIREPWLN